MDIKTVKILIKEGFSDEEMAAKFKMDVMSFRKYLIKEGIREDTFEFDIERLSRDIHFHNECEKEKENKKIALKFGVSKEVVSAAKKKIPSKMSVAVDEKTRRHIIKLKSFGCDERNIQESTGVSIPDIKRVLKEELEKTS